MWRLIFGLGILEIGERFAKELARKFGNLDALMDAGIDDIKSLDDFGSKSVRKRRRNRRTRAGAFYKGVFEDPHNRELIERLRAQGVNFKMLSPSLNVSGTPFSGKTFAINYVKVNGKRRCQACHRGFMERWFLLSQLYRLFDFRRQRRGAKAKKAEELGTPILTKTRF
ncbi:MAG: helix-hairpin-helix domain-containing protein [Bacilli bacterium]